MNYLVLDTETAGSLEEPLVYDFAWQVSNKNFEPIIAKRYLVKEVFFGMADKMQSAYYADKLPAYYQALADKQLEVKPFIEIMQEFAQDIKAYNIKVAWAYNMHFDRKALNNTIKVLSNGFKNWFFPYGLKLQCILAFACDTILKRPSYFKFAIANNCFTDKGNIKTGAEKAYAYLIKNPDYVEAHTALEDVKIENYILSRCYSVHSKGKKDKKPKQGGHYNKVMKAYKKWLNR